MWNGFWIAVFPSDEAIERMIDISATWQFMTTFVVIVVVAFVGMIAWCEYDLARSREELP